MYYKFPDEFLVPVISIDHLMENIHEFDDERARSGAQIKFDISEYKIEKNDLDEIQIENKEMVEKEEIELEQRSIDELKIEKCDIDECIIKKCSNKEEDDKEINIDVELERFDEGLNYVKNKKLWAELDEEYAKEKTEN